MSQHDRADEIGFLRRAIAQIEGAPAQGQFVPKAWVKLGADEGPIFSLDFALGGGLPTGSLYEIVPARANDAAAAAGFALALAARLGRARAGAIVWIGQDFAGREYALPYGPGLAAHGLDPAHLILVNVATPRDLVWVMEEALKCPACAAVIGEFWSSRPQPELLAALRLLRAARNSAGAGFLLVHPNIDFAYRIFSRLEVGGSRAQPSSGRRKPLPLCPIWAVRMLKAQALAGRFSGPDPDIIHPIVWNPQGAFFRDALPFTVARKLGDRGGARAQGA
jgi:protein ImuA